MKLSWFSATISFYLTTSLSSTTIRFFPTITTIATSMSVVGGMASSSSPSPSARKVVIDSHLHVWADTKEASEGYPFAEGQDPPDSLKEVASASSLLEKMDAHNVAGALIVQPINHKYDHSYVENAMRRYPDRFKGMLLHDPTLSPEDAVTRLEELALRGFVGVRFNPYLWPPKNKDDDGLTHMSTPGGGGIAIYRRCAELRMPVGVMCFKGLPLHYDDIVKLLESSPETTMILDHFGFTSLDADESFEQILKLAEFPQVVVKISALFRLGDEAPYERVRKERFEPLLKAFGPNRLMFGTDFPFVLEQKAVKYGETVELVSSWLEDESAKASVMGGTAERLFGQWS